MPREENHAGFERCIAYRATVYCAKPAHHWSNTVARDTMSDPASLKPDSCLIWDCPLGTQGGHGRLGRNALLVERKHGATDSLHGKCSLAEDEESL